MDINSLDPKIIPDLEKDNPNPPQKQKIKKKRNDKKISGNILNTVININKKKKIEENTININNNDNNMQIDSNINQGINMINAPYSSENLNKSKEELNKKMDIFINNAMNMNINPFSSPFGLTDINPENNNGTLNNNSNTNL